LDFCPIDGAAIAGPRTKAEILRGCKGCCAESHLARRFICDAASTQPPVRTQTTGQQNRSTLTLSKSLTGVQGAKFILGRPADDARASTVTIA